MHWAAPSDETTRWLRDGAPKQKELMLSQKNRY